MSSNLPSAEVSPLERGERWIRVARASIGKHNLALAATALKTADAAFALASPSLYEPESLVRLERGRARCMLLQADLAIHHWRLGDAEHHLDHAYRSLRDAPDLDAELWRLTARLAERRGRWPSALAAWKRAATMLPETDLLGLADLSIRMAEVELLSGNAEKAMVLLLQTEVQTEGIEEPLVPARIRLLHATILELNHQFVAAEALYKDVIRLSATAPRSFMGLVLLRAARPMIRTNQDLALQALENGFIDLTSDEHPDAEGMTLSQLAVLALIMGRPEIAALATLAAEAWRGGLDGTNRPLLCEAIDQFGFPTLAGQLSLQAAPAAENTKLREVLTPAARKLEVRWEDLKSTCTIGVLVESLRDRPSVLRVSVLENPTMPDDHGGLLLRQRASLTWDMPPRLQRLPTPETHVSLGSLELPTLDVPSRPAPSTPPTKGPASRAWLAVLALLVLFGMAIVGAALLGVAVVAMAGGLVAFGLLA